ENWHLLHLYQPRAVVEDSVMPAFKWLFRVEKHPSAAETTISVPEPWGPEAGTVVATERAQALVAYLKSLQQAPVPGASTRNKGGSSASAKSGDGSASGAGPNGESIYESKCASCHQSDGGGVPGTFPPLAGDPVVTADDPTRHVEIVLDGLQGKTIEGTEYGAAMPAFGSQLKDSEIAAVINHERTSWGNDAPTITAEDVAAVRSGKSLEGDSASDGEPDAGATADTSDDSDAGSTPREAGP
ncbi:MAG: cytochrome c, partial [Bradymonadaceae bacterium]